MDMEALGQQIRVQREYDKLLAKAKEAEDAGFHDRAEIYRLRATTMMLGLGFVRLEGVVSRLTSVVERLRNPDA